MPFSCMPSPNPRPVLNVTTECDNKCSDGLGRVILWCFLKNVITALET
jgi:hypothetical protein